MKKILFSAVLATAFATCFAFAPAAFADDMKKDTMKNDAILAGYAFVTGSTRWRSWR